jgi:hypothetical protein
MWKGNLMILRAEPNGAPEPNPIRCLAVLQLRGLLRAEALGRAGPGLGGLLLAVLGLGGRLQALEQAAGDGGDLVDGGIEGFAVSLRRGVEAGQLADELERGVAVARGGGEAVRRPSTLRDLSVRRGGGDAAAGTKAAAVGGCAKAPRKVRFPTRRERLLLARATQTPSQASPPGSSPTA